MTAKYEKIKNNLSELITRYASEEKEKNIQLESVNESIEDIMSNIDELTTNIQISVDKHEKLKQANDNIEFQKKEHISMASTVAGCIMLLGLTMLIFKAPFLSVLNIAITEEFFSIIVFIISYKIKTKKDREFAESTSSMEISKELSRLVHKKGLEEQHLSESLAIKEVIEERLSFLDANIDKFEYVYDMIFNEKVADVKDERVHDHFYSRVLSLIHESKKNKE